MKTKTLTIAALAVAMSGALAGSTLAEPRTNSQSAMQALAARQAALQAAAREAAALKAQQESDARKAERDRILQRTVRYDPFTYRQGMSQYEVHKMVAMRMKQRHEHMRSPGKPPEDPGDHDNGHGNDDHDHGPHDDHDNGNHNGQGSGH